MRLSASDLSIDTALDNVIDFERRITFAPLHDRVSVAISPSRRQIIISTAGQDYMGNLDAKLIHQLGSHIWRGLDRSATIKQWLDFSQVDLVQGLENALSHSGYVLRSTETGNGRQIYGLTSSNFVDMNQRHFRDALVQSLQRLGIIPREMVYHTPFGEVVEEFAVPGSDQQVGLTCKAVYGLNNGYSSYRLNWGRVVLICQNGLTAFRNTGRDRWIHTNNVRISDFAEAAAAAAYSHLSDVEKQIAAARARAINYTILDQFMTRLALASATKSRVAGRLEHEFNDTGANEWSVSQALTFLGEHEKAIPLRVRDNLTRLGSRLLEHSLAEVTSSSAVVTPSGFYDLLRW